VLLRNRVSVSRLVAVDMKGSYRSLDQLGEVASGDNLLGSNISEGDKTNIPDSHGTPVAHLDKGPATVTAFIRPAEGKKQTLLFAEPYDVNWRLGGEPAAQNLGVTSAFSLGTQWGKVTITYRNTRLLAGYAVSGLGLILCVILLALDALKSRQGKDPV
jgi:hypothetical protein